MEKDRKAGEGEGKRTRRRERGERRCEGKRREEVREGKGSRGRGDEER